MSLFGRRTVATILAELKDTIAELDRHHVASIEAEADHINLAARHQQQAAHHSEQAAQAARVREKLAELIAEQPAVASKVMGQPFGLLAVTGAAESN